MEGRLPPFEGAKAYAFDAVLAHMEKFMGKSASVLLGEEKGSFIAKRLKKKGGGGSWSRGAGTPDPGAKRDT